MKLLYIDRIAKIALFFILFCSYNELIANEGIHYGKQSMPVEYSHYLRFAYDYYQKESDPERHFKKHEDEMDTARAFLRKIPITIQVEYFTNLYYGYLNEQENTESIDIFECMDKKVINEVLIRTCLLRKNEDRILPTISAKWFSFSGNEPLRASVDSVVLQEKDSCQKSLWHAIYLFKGRSWPGSVKGIHCPVIDKIVRNKKRINRNELNDVYEKFCDWCDEKKAGCDCGH